MANEESSNRLASAGIKDAKNLPEEAVAALSKLSDEELGALAKAQEQLAPLGNFGGIIF